jgi:hypothetical protein
VLVALARVPPHVFRKLVGAPEGLDVADTCSSLWWLSMSGRPVPRGTSAAY